MAQLQNNFDIKPLVNTLWGLFFFFNLIHCYCCFMRKWIFAIYYLSECFWNDFFFYNSIWHNIVSFCLFCRKSFPYYLPLFVVLLLLVFILFFCCNQSHTKQKQSAISCPIVMSNKEICSLKTHFFFYFSFCFYCFFSSSFFCKIYQIVTAFRYTLLYNLYTLFYFLIECFQCCLMNWHVYGVLGIS